MTEALAGVTMNCYLNYILGNDQFECDSKMSEINKKYENNQRG